MNNEMDVAEALEQYGFVIRSFKGTSMLPLLVEGRDAVKLVRPENVLKKYDIVLFKRENGDLVLHRIVRVFDKGYYIRGDNCLWSETVVRKQIIAVAEGVYLNGIYHNCSESEIEKYALRQKLTLPWRRLKYYVHNTVKSVYTTIKR